jgi:hypothetical protein
MSLTEIDLDRPIWGARKIAEAAGLVDDNGEPDERSAYYQLEKGHLPGRKVGRLWTSTIRQLRSIAIKNTDQRGKAAADQEAAA